MTATAQGPTFTPRFNGQRVAIPVAALTMNADGKSVGIRDGEYPVIEPDTGQTVKLGGVYRRYVRPCGLGCRCDSEIVQVQTGGGR